MTDRQPFLKSTYGGYRVARVPAEDAELTHVGPGTPAGEYLRRFWQPVALTQDLGELPRAIRILGEDLVVFRDLSGRVGLLHKHCSHRGTSLEYGRLEKEGVRCCYHGWLFAVDGTILETPNDPSGRSLAGRLCHGAYPVREFEGLIFAYMGPPEAEPPFRMLDTFEVPDHELGLGNPIGFECVKPCNWLQIMDNVVDPVHEPFLHARHSGYQFLNEDGKPVTELEEVGEYDFVETPAGLLCQETRRIGEDVWVRQIEYVVPNIAQIPRTPVFPARYPNGADEVVYLPWVTRWRVPIDDENTAEFALVRLKPGEENIYITDPGPVVRTNYGGRPYEEMQRYPGDYEAQISQRPIARHGTEHLTTSDRGVMLMRETVRQGIRAVAAGDDPRGLARETEGRMATYGSDVVFRLPRAGAEDADSAVLCERQEAVARRALETPPVVAGGAFRI
ncbi:MAG: Rieske 2Fe-2S domain-containing protein [Rhodospirillaceae bacterium]|jgi:phenylpropionate dioxygenase-like ring-hydroxylating dioxygenase large terminal subunit|nr:Rieske 2Fe-2S domain-containing protein [Rhodospirillaceae bacterium]